VVVVAKKAQNRETTTLFNLRRETSRFVTAKEEEETHTQAHH